MSLNTGLFTLGNNQICRASCVCHFMNFLLKQDVKGIPQMSLTIKPTG